MTRVIAPALGGVLLQGLGAWAPGVASGMLVAWAAWFAWRRLILRPDSPLRARSDGAAWSGAAGE